jgi:ComF family protein
MASWLPEGIGAEAPRSAAARPAVLALAGAGARRGMTAAGALARAVLDVALPPVCLACRRPVADADALCVRCWSGLRLIDRPFCERLGTPFAYDLGPGALSAEAIADPPPFERARAAVLYGDVARTLVHALKYRDRTEIAALLGRMAAHAGRDVLADAEAIVPVPLHRGRLWRRRFNQAAAIAAAIGRTSGIAVDPFALERIRPTPQQVGLDARSRADNVRGAFRVADERRERVLGRRVVLVDDVLTSGATVAAATRALLRAKAARVDVLVFARVVKAETN